MSTPVAKDMQALQEMIKTQPTLKRPLLWLELRHVEREILLCESIRDVVRVEIIASVRSVLATAVSLGMLVLIYIKLVQLAVWLEQVKTITIPLPPPLSRSAVLDLTSYIPSSTALNILSDLPRISWQTAGKGVLVIVLLVALEKTISGYQTWQRGKRLHATMEELDEEAKTLKTWLKE